MPSQPPAGVHEIESVGCERFRRFGGSLVASGAAGCISPDGDGVNDEFYPVLPGFEIDDYEFRIFNRWGRQIFLTYSSNSGWSGDDMPAGYYFWKIKGKSKIEQEPVDLSGYLFLLR